MPRSFAAALSRILLARVIGLGYIQSGIIDDGSLVLRIIRDFVHPGVGIAPRRRGLHDLFDPHATGEGLARPESVLCARGRCGLRMRWHSQPGACRLRPLRRLGSPASFSRGACPVRPDAAGRSRSDRYHLPGTGSGGPPPVFALPWRNLLAGPSAATPGPCTPHYGAGRALGLARRARALPRAFCAPARSRATAPPAARPRCEPRAPASASPHFLTRAFARPPRDPGPPPALASSSTRRLHGTQLGPWHPAYPSEGPDDRSRRLRSTRPKQARAPHSFRSDLVSVRLLHLSLRARARASSFAHSFV